MNPDVTFLSDFVRLEAAHKLAAHYPSTLDLMQCALRDAIPTDLCTPTERRRLNSAFRFSQRVAELQFGDRPMIDTPEAAAALLLPRSVALSTEHAWTLILDARRRLIRLVDIAVGTLDGITLHPREIFRPAITHNGAGILLVHNHPSGDPSPSEADVRFTRTVSKAGELLQIPLLDHIVIGRAENGRVRPWCSLRELGHFSY